MQAERVKSPPHTVTSRRAPSQLGHVCPTDSRSPRDCFRSAHIRTFARTELSHRSVLVMAAQQESRFQLTRPRKQSVFGHRGIIPSTCRRLELCQICVTVIFECLCLHLLFGIPYRARGTFSHYINVKMRLEEDDSDITVTQMQQNTHILQHVTHSIQLYLLGTN